MRTLHEGFYASTNVPALYGLLDGVELRCSSQRSSTPSIVICLDRFLLNISEQIWKFRCSIRDSKELICHFL